jgi:hypothetical protein
LTIVTYGALNVLRLIEMTFVRVWLKRLSGSIPKNVESGRASSKQHRKWALFTAKKRTDWQKMLKKKQAVRQSGNPLPELC